VRTHIALLLAAFVLAGCNQHANAPASSESSKAAAPPVDQATAGTITGVVHFLGTPPQPVKIDMGLDPACNMAADPNYSEQVVAKDGKLANVYVYIKSGLTPHSYPQPAEPVTITQKGCRYEPHVAGARTGETIRVINADPAMHNIHPAPKVAGNHEWNLSQMPKGDPIERRFDAPEVMMPVKCNQHPWMKMYLNLADNPYYAVTDTNGTFQIANLPPGDYTLAAVHEKYGEKDITIHITPNQTQQVSFDFNSQ
jgi:plastocyanin